MSSPESMLEGILSPTVAACSSTLVVIGTICIFLWCTRPGMIMKKASDVSMYFLGFQKKKARSGKIKLTYIERGKRTPAVPSLLFIHGFSADKGMYMPVLMLLPRSQHTVVVDLPGHGESETPDKDEKMSLEILTNMVKSFVDSIQLNSEPFHIIGTSLGGAIATTYSALYPKDIAKATLVCPAMFTPVETPFQKEVREGKCILLGKTVDEVGVIMERCLHQQKRVYKNKQVLMGLAQQRAPQQHFYEKVFDAITSTMDNDQHQFLYVWSKSIKLPTQIIWGRNDQILDVSGAKLLQDCLPNCIYVDLFDRCGHIVSFDRPGGMAKALKKFMKYTEKDK